MCYFVFKVHFKMSINKQKKSSCEWAEILMYIIQFILEAGLLTYRMCFVYPQQNRNGCTIIRSQLLHIYQVFLQLSLPPLLSSWVASLFPNMFSTSPRLSGPDAISLMECWYVNKCLPLLIQPQLSPFPV